MSKTKQLFTVECKFCFHEFGRYPLREIKGNVTYPECHNTQPMLATEPIGYTRPRIHSEGFFS